MCGIAGIASFQGKPIALEELEDMCAALWHRGPDEGGFYVSPQVGLGMRRLSIIDLETGRQPIRNEDGSIWVVLNGEIYNYKQLIADLQRRGHSFYTSTDTETIVHLYEEYGPLCVEKLRGMFALALWDERRQRLLLARDRLGIKPLYYTEVSGRLVFASELKAILQLPAVKPRLNWTAVSRLFALLTTPHTESVVEGVHKLEPGHLLTASPGEAPVIRPYWNVEFQPRHDLREEDLVEELRHLLRESVELHMVSDVPLGAFLSGGLDSSSVVAAMARLTSRPVKTFSIGFSEDDYNELEYARLVAKRLGTEHHELVLEPNALDIVEDLAWFLDEPFGDPSAIPTYMVSKLAAQHVKVALSGDGGDELFAGYDKYLVERRERRFRFLPPPLRALSGSVSKRMPEGMRGRNFLHHLSLEGVDRYLDACAFFKRDQQRQLFRTDVYELLSDHDPLKRSAELLAEGPDHWLSSLQYLDLKSYLPLDILAKVDRMSMAHSLEARVPLLDHKVVEFAAGIPPALQMRGSTRKHLFKQAMRGILPDEIIDRPKRGFAIPLGRWFRGQLDGFVRDLLLSEASRQRGILDTGYIERLLDLNRRGRDLDFHLWTLISFELWCRTFLDGTRRNVERRPPGRQDARLVVERGREHDFVGERA